MPDKNLALDPVWAKYFATNSYCHDTASLSRRPVQELAGSPTIGRLTSASLGFRKCSFYLLSTTRAALYYRLAPSWGVVHSVIVEFWGAGVACG